MKRFLVILLGVLFWSNASYAQQAPAEDPVAAAPIRLGPFGFGPRFSISNFGWDNNVFNDATNEKADFTFTTTPALDMWLRTGRGLLSLTGSLDLVYYAEYENQRAINSHATGQYEYRFNRVRPLASFSIADVKDRPGYEIDTRVQSFTDTLTAGADVRLASKTFLEVAYRQGETTYADDAVYNDQNLKDTLDRKLKAVDGTLRYRKSSITTMFLRVSSEQERFDTATERNSNSGRASVGFELGRFALIRGKAEVGFRSLAAADGGTLPPYRGLTADVDVTYTAPTQTRITTRVTRDVQYSYDVVTPYYIQTGFVLTLTQRITGRWDVQAQGGQDQLDYQSTSSDPSVERTDFVSRVGGGLGYQLAEQTRVGFDIQLITRRSPLQPEYRNTRAFASVSYVY